MAKSTPKSTTPSNVQTRAYTCDGQTFEITTGRWSGVATSTTADLNGAVVLHVKSVYNATKKLGWIDGRLTIAAADGRTHAGISGVNSDGKLDAWVRGSAGRGDGTLFGSLSGSFSKTGGLTDGAIGSGAGANAAVIAKGIRCRPEKAERPSVHLVVRGQIETVSATSITVKPKDDTASQTCTQIGATWVLTKVRKR